jgi:hypothetical protein
MSLRDKIRAKTKRNEGNSIEPLAKFCGRAELFSSE